MQFKGTQKRAPDIARELNVDGIVAGAALLSGGQVRMTVQLIHAATDRHVWADDYEPDATAGIALPAEVARAIATEMKKGGAQRPFPPVSRTSPVSPEAHDLYLKGLRATGHVNYEGFVAGASYFEQAIVTQPDFGWAYARLAQTWVQFLIRGSDVSS